MAEGRLLRAAHAVASRDTEGRLESSGLPSVYLPGANYRMTTRTRSNFLIAALFIVAGAAHFVIPDRYLSIMPPWMPHRMGLVYLSGLLEIAGGAGVLIPNLRKAAGIGLIALLIAVFPANIQMLSNAISAQAAAWYIAILFLRLPLQPLLIVWVYRSTIRNAMPTAT